MSVKSQGGFNFLALWGGTEGEDDSGSGRGREGGHGSDRGEQKAAGVGEVVKASSDCPADPGKRIAVSCLMSGFHFPVFLDASVTLCTRRSVNES